MTMAPAADPISLLAERLVGALDNRSKAYHPPYYDFATGFKHDTAGNPITVGYSHGPGGNLSWPGVDQAVFHTVVGIRGILGQLPATPSLYTNPTYTILTGVSDDVGGEKTDVCDDAPVAGLLQACTVTSRYGRYERATKEIEINRLGQQVDRSDPMDLTLVGSPIAQTGIFTTGPGGTGVPGNLLSQEVARKMWELSVSLHRLMSRQVWQGNPTNDSAGGGYKEMLGLDGLIRTGYVDAITGTRCYSVDADVKDFNYANIAVAGASLVNAMTYLYHTRKEFAISTGVMPVRWVWVMRSEVFFELSALWPCAYLTYRCDIAGVTGAAINMDAREVGALRDSMRNERFIPIDGDRIEVILDDGIAVETGITNNRVASGCSASSIYLVPMSVTGGRQVTYLEYAQYDNPAIMDAIGRMVLAQVEGAWITWPRQTNLCVQWQTKIEPRVVMRTPWLSGRLDNVVVCPLQYAPQPFPDNPYAFTDNGGGVTQRSGPSYYQLWNQV